MLPCGIIFIMKYALVALAFLLPSGLILADTTGFAQDSVWVSHLPIVEGETVLIHAALTNGSNKQLTGTLVFKDNSTSIGSVPFVLVSGEARIISLSWKATAGSHSITASITSASNADATQTQSVDVSVDAKPAPVSPIKKGLGTTSAAAVAFTNASDIENGIGSVSPKAQEISSPLFKTVDSLRKSGAELLASQIESTQAKVADLSAQKEKLSKQNTPEATSEGRKVTAYQVLTTILLYIYEVLLFAISKAAFFYPIFAFLVFFILYKGYQRFRRPTYDY